MKKPLILTSLVFATSCSAIAIAQFAGIISFSNFSLPALVGAAIASGLVGLVFSDYSRRPRFRVHKPTALPETPIAACREDSVTLWTYTTRSV